MYKPSRDMPKEGCFIAIWTYRGNVWCGNYKWHEGQLQCLKDGDNWEADAFPYTEQENIIYVTLEEK